MGKINLLDCTLRDGGYVNDWNFGHNSIVNIFERLVSAGIDIIETGFLDERRPFDKDRSIMPDTESLNRIYGHLDKGNSLVVAMIDYGTCGIEHIMPCSDCFLDGIRVIFKRAKMRPALEFCRELKKLGYKVFAQAVSITSYDDGAFKELTDLVNDVEPYAFSLVDTYGLLHRQDLDHYFSMADSMLKPTIGIGYHAHNNFQLAYSNCIELLENPPKRMMLVDGTLYGMGKSAGNAPIELIAMYMNSKCGKKYDKSQLLEAIDVSILDIYRQIPWGYSFKFYLSASNDCHPNYVTYLTEKKKLSIRSVGEILNSIAPEKKLLYDKDYIESLYISYQRNECDDADAVGVLRKKMNGRNILLLAPGSKVYEQSDRILSYIESERPIVISTNFIPTKYDVDYVFLSNAKKYVLMSTSLLEEPGKYKLIATSNLTKAEGRFDYVLNYSRLLDEDAKIVDNPMIMMLRMLIGFGIDKVSLAGFDGYTEADTANYVNPNMEHENTHEKALMINEDARESLRRLGDKIKYTFITESLYDKQ